ncbi:MAG: AsnC family transcriptional regulator, partial [Lentisphaerae bacterium]|nr:AsnC family transcriptional regulator [Lentisphaerota bacterium]
TRIQGDFPLVSRPYDVLADALKASDDEIRKAIDACRDTEVIRRIGGSFSAAHLGYVSALIAARVEPLKIAAVARHAAQFEEVTHDYERDDTFNLWFTVVAETTDLMTDITDSVRAQSGVHSLHVLPALQTFKLRVRFDMMSAEGEAIGPARDTVDTSGTTASPDSPASCNASVLDDTDRRLIARCCDDISASRTPFADLARDVGIDESAALARLRRYRGVGIMRRFGAMVRHQRAGFTANAMGVWSVPPPDATRVGAVLAGSRAVSHCYERPRFADWPYNLYSMIHGHSVADCRAVHDDLMVRAGITESRLLFTDREFKKSSVRYFAEHRP